MGFSRPEYWSGLPFPSPGDLPDPGIEPGSPMLQADALTSEPPGKEKYIYHLILITFINPVSVLYLFTPFLNQRLKQIKCPFYFCDF